MELTLPPWIFALLPALLMLAALFWGAPAIALISELIGMVTNKPFPIRCGQQVSKLALKGHGVFWLAAIAAGAFLFAHPFWMSEFAQVNQLLLLLILALPALGSLLLAAYDLSWKGSKQRRLMHFLLGCLANVCIKYGYWGLVVLALLLFRGLPLNTPAFIPTSGSALWPFFGLWMPLSLSLASGLGLCYLVLRRDKDDWGRDYYRFAAPFLAKWHLMTSLACLALLIWLFLSLKDGMNLFLPWIFYPGMASVGCLALGMLLTLALILNENPMRMKVAMLGVVLANYLHVGFFLLAVCETLTHYAPGWSLPTFVPELLRLFLE